MLNFDRIIPAAAKAAGDQPILAAPYPLPSVLCRDLSSNGTISGYIAETSKNLTDGDPLIAGWWIDRGEGIWFLRRRTSRTIILLGYQRDSDISGRMLLEARLKGCKRILLIGPDGSIEREIDAAAELLQRVGEKSLHSATYEDAFEEMYELLGDRLRLPERTFDSERVVIVSGSLQAGGAERQATYTACGLARRLPGKVHVARSHSGGAADFYKTVLDAAGISTHVMLEDEEYSSPDIMRIRNKLASRYFSLGFLDIFYMIFHQALMLQALRPGLVHCFQDYSNTLAGVAADLVGVPRLVLSGRSVAPDHFGIFQPYMAPAYHALLKRREVAFLNNSDAGAGDYARWLGIPRERFRVVQNGFEFPEPRPPARDSQRRRLGISNSAVLIGSIIGFREEKRPYLFLEMARALHTIHPNTQFVIFGEGALLQACRNFVESENLSKFVHLPGLTDNAWAALSAMDIFVLTSRMEGLPNVLIEAQAMGIPVVCTAAGGMKETFIEGQTGYSVSSATPDALAATVGRIIEDGALRARMGAAAQAYARETFSIDRMVDHTLEVYSSTPVYKNEIIPDWRIPLSSSEIRISGAVKEEGQCFVATLPVGSTTSKLCLWEDDHRLGPMCSDREQIITAGEGRYAVLASKILFSSSDRSDVRFNGRTYRMRPEDADPDFDEIVIKPEVISAEIGFCYIAHLELSEGSGRISFWESGSRLGPGGCMHDQVRMQGAGCYSAWGSDLYFSTSDNSDPRSNGRTYILRSGRRFSGASEEPDTWAGVPLERALRHMLRNAAPRNDFVPGRVVHIIGSLGPGGAERQALYTLSGLGDHSFESAQLLCYYLGASGTNRHDFYLPAYTAAGIPVRAVRRQVGDGDLNCMPASLREIWQALPQGLAPDIADLFNEFTNLRPEIVHAWLDGNNIRAGLAAALAGVPKIFMSGRNVNPTNFDYLYEPCMHPVYKALLELPQVTMVNNSYAGRDDYAHWLGIDANRIVVIHNGCNFPLALSEEARQAAREAYNISVDAIVVGTVTRLSEEKQPNLFVEMAHRALQSQPNLRFVFFGIGPLHDEVQTLINHLGVSESVTLMGITNDIWAALSAMDVFVLTSRFEGLPNVLIEAQCVGVPVVATNVGGAPETFINGKTGLGLDAPTPEALAEALLRLTLDPGLRRKMSAAASDFSRTQFSVPKMILRTLELYKRC